MGTDVHISHRACICGKGQIEITVTSPDHAYASAYNVHRDERFLCVPCGAEYTFDHGRVVRKKDLAAYRKGWEDWYAAAKAFDQSPEVAALRAAFAAHLSGLKTKKAVHAYLTEHKIANDKYGSFTRRYQDAQQYVTDIHTSAMPKLAKLLGQDPGPFEARIAVLEAAQKAIPSVPTVKDVSAGPPTQ